MHHRCGICLVASLYVLWQQTWILWQSFICDMISAILPRTSWLFWGLWWLSQDITVVGCDARLPSPRRPPLNTNPMISIMTEASFASSLPLAIFPLYWPWFCSLDYFTFCSLVLLQNCYGCIIGVVAPHLILFDPVYSLSTQFWYLSLALLLPADDFKSAMDVDSC